MPVPPSAANVRASLRLAMLVKRKKPTARPAKCERGPGEEWEEPRLRVAENMDAVDVGLERPREAARAVRGPEKRGGHSHESGDKKAGEDSPIARSGDGLRKCGGVCRIASGGEPAEDAHQHDRETEHIEDVDAQEIGPGRPPVAERVFLDAKEEAESEDFCAAENGCFRDFGGSGAFFSEAFRYQCDGNTGKKEE